MARRDTFDKSGEREADRSWRGEWEDDYGDDYGEEYGEEYDEDYDDGYDGGRGDYDDEYDWRGDDDGGRGGRKRPLRWVIPIVAVLAAAAIALGVTTVYASRISKKDTIYPNVSVNGTAVGGLTVNQAAQKLLDEGASSYTDASVTVLFPLDHTLTVTAEELGLAGGAEAPAEAAYAYGRDGSAFQNLKTYLACKKGGVELEWDAGDQIDSDALERLVSDTAEEVNAAMLNAEAQIGDDGVTVVKGMNGAEVDTDAVCAAVAEAFRAQDYTDIEGQLVQTGATEAYDVLQTIYDTIYVEPVNAEYDQETGGVTESAQGVSFDMDAAMALWDAADFGDEVFIPFIFTDPEIDSETLAERLFADCLSEKSTTLSGSSSNRINNVTLAAAALNGTVINPGETFDYNTCLGERTSAKGYKEAGAYENGQHVTSVGGGICQDSSTLYYCALYANLKITVRSCHYFVVSYLPWGMDATVSWGGPDFQFVNSRDYPIQIKAWVSNGSLTVQIWGTDVDGSYVKITSDTWEDSEYYYAQTYRTVYNADGSQISSEKEAYSRYHKYEAGAEEEEQTTPTPTPTDTPPTATPTPTDTPPTATPTPTDASTATPTPTDAPTATPTPTDTPPTVTPTPPVSTDNGGDSSGGDSGDSGGGENSDSESSGDA